MRYKTWIIPTAFVVSSMAHAGLGAINWSAEPTGLDGGAVAGDAALGTSFADLINGVMTATPDQILPPAASDALPPLEPIAPQQAAGAATSDYSLSTVDAADEILSSHKAQALTATALNAAVTRPVLLSSTPTVQTLEAAKTQTIIQAKLEPAPQAKPKTTTTARKKPKAQPKPAHGNTKVNARKGNKITGQEDKHGAGSGAKKTAAAKVGNGALSSYKTKVLRKVARARHRSAGDRGTAYISVSISPSGAVGGVSIARSSGKSRVDRAALQMVKGAGPFGATPNGRALSYVIKVKVRG
ncbi:TonB family protein [Epibacterium sp. SM1969]|uniref:TonB family protein n=1 Tax=Tritonibacter aquimaris TaxID=2663379 RepID=A0A844ANJ7_9RHOB|nr:TonB family protein [Tritonibacter aquimaris]MQY44205.1 TonB family protein [Tritonibacter aquimaris]